MIDLYTWGTPNGRKVSIMLEETGLKYQAFPINITKDEQFAPDFLAVNPNNKIPAIVDHAPPAAYGSAPYSVFESGAILIYLAEKSGQFLPADARARGQALQWLMWQMGGFGPMLGQTHHFVRFAKEKVPYAIERFSTETKRLYGVLNAHLGKNEYLAGADYSIADMATHPWAGRHEWHGINLADYPHVQRWFDGIMARPAVQRGYEVP
ncbi:glutathione binding-like protein [Ferrovibrio sp.]|uniref:glutathione binding-like protein n=1 Tax=Ferrovibrio sp. TaxID=1917215 RepID=UPI001B6B4C28|nr:glutathione binding-like protein [Ferrovibrio sp.]MBP7066294.1 glutathione S-transferase N-terminal domain-containing protein [Ferrovibrio sp.]